MCLFYLFIYLFIIILNGRGFFGRQLIGRFSYYVFWPFILFLVRVSKQLFSSQAEPRIFVWGGQDKTILLIFLSMIWSLVVYYFLGFTVYKAASGRVFLRCGTTKDAVLKATRQKPLARRSVYPRNPHIHTCLHEALVKKKNLKSKV